MKVKTGEVSSRKSILSYFSGAPRPLQEKVLLGIEKEWDNFDVFVINAPVGCHAAGQGVLLANGNTKSVEDIKVGDELMGPDSHKRTVTHTLSDSAQMYKIKTLRGQDYIVTGNHILCLYLQTRKHFKGNRYPCKKYIEITVEDYLSQSIEFKKNTRLKRVGIEFPKQDLLIHPYILGVWLGDGNSDRTSITTKDHEITFIWQKEAEKRNLYTILDQKPNNKAYTFTMSKGMTRRIPNSLSEDLRTLNVWKNKHIPEVYLKSSRRQRLLLLAGLMDTDGYFSSKKHSAEITQSRKHLAESILYLCRSLGFEAHLSTKLIKGKPYYRVGFSGKLTDIPVQIQYKKENRKDVLGDNTYVGFTIEKDIVRPYFGFKVDKDNRYLLDDFTIDHNSGKSKLSLCIGNWCGKADILTPTNLLVEQYREEVQGNYPSLLKKELYPCCKKFGKKPHSPCEKTKDFRKLMAQGRGIMNYYMYMWISTKTRRKNPSVLLVDEAHNLVPTLQGLMSKKIWQHDLHYPDDLQTLGDLAKWCKTKKTSTSLSQETKETLDLIIDQCESQAPTYILEKATEEWRKTQVPEERSLIRLKPIEVSRGPKIFWGSHIEKLVLLSATLSRKDIEAMGLQGKRILYLECESPIPKAQRPVKFIPVASVTRTSQKQDAREIGTFISNYLLPLHDGEKGVLHVTYQMAKELRPWLKGDRFIYHDQSNKKSRYHEFLSSPPDSGKVLVASGLYEGIDLPGDLGRWQCVVKVPWLSLGDRAVKFQSERDPLWYQWETLKTLIQASGRVCRGPKDFGVTYILDSTFGRLYNQSQRLLPTWFTESLILFPSKEDFINETQTQQAQTRQTQHSSLSLSGQNNPSTL